MQLDFFETIEGTSGEELTSAVLKYLIVNSPTFRDCLIDRISKLVPPGYVPSFRNGLYCRTEHPTEDQKLGNGFIDIILCDGQPNQISFVAAFEVKLWAEFTPNQPAKYVGTLKKMVNEDLSRVLIIVLAPDERTIDVLKHLQEQSSEKPAIPWTWNEIRKDLEKVAVEDSPSIAVVAKWLIHFLKVRIGAMNLQGTPDAYVGQNVKLGNTYHYDFLYKLKSCLLSPGRVIMRDGIDQYIGFSCECVARESKEQFVAKVWIGFVPKDTDRTAIIFGIDTGLAPCDQNTFCKWGREFKEIPFDAELKTALQWQERLTKELIVIQERRKQSIPTDVVKS